jgi:hypothetical protein
MQLGEPVNFLRSANRLSHFQRTQLCDDEVSKHQGEQKSGDRRRNGSESDVKENVEPDELPTQVMEIVHHGEMTNDD